LNFEGEEIKLIGKGIFFMRTTKPGKPINPNGTSDNDVLFGEMSEHSLSCLNILINNLYKPLVERLEPAEWGVCEEEQKKEFQQVFDKFAVELKDALSSLSGMIQLEPYDAQYEEDARNVHSLRQLKPDMITHFTNVFGEWIKKIEQQMDETEALKIEEKDPGPKSELDFWR